MKVLFIILKNDVVVFKQLAFLYMVKSHTMNDYVYVDEPCLLNEKIKMENCSLHNDTSFTSKIFKIQKILYTNVLNLIKNYSITPPYIL